MANVIIKRSKRDEYLACSGWTVMEEEALVFPSSLQALDFCSRRRLQEVIIVIRFPDPRLNIELHPFASRTLRVQPEAAWQVA